MASKPKSLRCVVCDREFRRHEHLKRHARIHTHEKPFACACGQAFSRQDLLRRHERKLANEPHHASHSPNQATDQSNDHGQSSEQVSLDTPTSLLLDHVEPGPGVESGLQDPSTTSTATNADATGALNSNGDLTTLSYEPISTLGPHDVLSNWFPSESEWTLDGSGSFDATSMIPDFDLSSCFLMHDFGIAEDHPPQSTVVPQSGSLAQGSDGHRSESTALRQSDHHELGEANSISRFGSPLPTLPGRASNEGTSTATRTNQSRQGKITESEYRQIKEKLQHVKDILPSSFSLPSRQALSRYLRGYLKGLNEHFPIFHTPTLSIARTELVTLLSMATIGAMWCFEARQADTLFFATKSATLHKLDQFSTTLDHEDTSERSNIRSHILQALLHLIVAGTWGSSRLLREGLGLQSIAATLARELGFGESCPFEAIDSTRSISERWLSWVQAETRRRTLLMLYSYFNVMCLAYDIPPLILSSELGLDMPATVSLWTAETAQEWHSLHESAKLSPRMSFQSCISSLLTPSSPPVRQESMFTPLDNYITILALLQRIFFLRQAWAARACEGDDFVNGGTAEVPEAFNMRAALQRWQARWERSPDSIVDSPTWTGPIPFTSTALLRLAWIRLSTNLGPCRNLASRNPELIADAFFKAPTVRRSSQVTMPILQAVYALAVPVQTGVEFVARAQTVSWSVQHSLCNLECAIFLSKWLEEVAVTAVRDPLAPDELKLVALIRSMMRETSLFYEDDEFARLVSASSVISEEATRMLATAVAKVWAKIFQGTFAFSFANTIGASLRMYADRMEAATANAT